MIPINIQVNRDCHCIFEAYYLSDLPDPNNTVPEWFAFDNDTPTECLIFRGCISVDKWLPCWKRTQKADENSDGWGLNGHPCTECRPTCCPMYCTMLPYALPYVLPYVC